MHTPEVTRLRYQSCIEQSLSSPPIHTIPIDLVLRSLGTYIKTHGQPCCSQRPSGARPTVTHPHFATQNGFANPCEGLPGNGAAARNCAENIHIRVLKERHVCRAWA